MTKSLILKNNANNSITTYPIDILNRNYDYLRSIEYFKENEKLKNYADTRTADVPAKRVRSESV